MNNNKLPFMSNRTFFTRIILLTLFCAFATAHPLLAAIHVVGEASTGWQSFAGLVAKSSAIVEVKVSDNKKAFEVTNVFYGDLEKGAILDFDKCYRIRMNESSQETLTGVINAPVVDMPISDDWNIDLNDAEEILKFNKSTEAGRYILLIQLKPEIKTQDTWGFIVQTFGDFFLVQDGKVFRLAAAKVKYQFWTQYKTAPLLKDFMTNLNNEINKKQQSKGSGQ
jgi:hypothetical protein